MVAVGITGHRNLPAELAEQVSALLRAEIAALDLGPGELVGVTCLADGADTLFAREILAHGGTLEVIVPAEQYRDGLPAAHHAIFDEILAMPTTVVHNLDYVESTSESYMAASMLMLSLIAELVAVWDGLPARGYGGTADVVREARALQLPVRVVWPAGAVPRRRARGLLG